MKFLRLHDSLLSVLFEDDDIIAIDKPYGFNAHTNDSKIEHSEFIQDGLIEMYEKQLGRKLHIIHRLDQTTTGVMIFGKSTESAKKYAEFFFNRQVKKTYWFITKCKSSNPDFLIDTQIIHKGRELEAKTQLTLLKKENAFELWQANPFTGRNHQIRIHAEVAKIPILGDPKYNGHVFPFLCLHNHKIEFPNDIVITSKPPVYFENLELLNDVILTRALFEADRRLRLFSFSVPQDQCFRLVHAKTNSKDSGFTIDQLGRNMVLNWHKESWGDSDFKRFTYFANSMKKPLFVRLAAGKEKASPDKKHILICPSACSNPISPIWIAKEGETQYEIRSESGQSAGLFLNQRLQRNWLFNNSKGKSVLNIFSNTCGFSLAAALGQAAQVTSVDASKTALNWGKQNFLLNDLAPDKFIFLCRDSLSLLEQCRNKNIKYDTIICDAPSFVRREKGFFKIESGLEDLLKSCMDCLNPHGELLFSTCYDGFFIDDIRKAILRVQKTLKIPNLEINCILPALDFELPDERANLKSFLIKILP